MTKIIEQTTTQETAIVTSNGGAETAMLATALDDTFSALSENQKSILNSQAANRELLGVIIQDNFNLKEENNRLRERILELERSIARLQQKENDRFEAMRYEFDAKILAVQKLASEALSKAHTPAEVPEFKAVNNSPGCLGALFGMKGQTEFFSIARPKTAAEAAQESAAAASHHPKPIYPPE